MIRTLAELRAALPLLHRDDLERSQDVVEPPRDTPRRNATPQIRYCRGWGGCPNPWPWCPTCHSAWRITRLDGLVT